MLHTAERGSRSALECWVERWYRLNQVGHPGVDRLRRVRKRLLELRGNLRLQQLVQRRLILRLERFERQLVLGQKPERGRIEERGAGAGIHQRHRHTEVFVNAAQLAEIRKLVRARDVTDGWEQGVLHDRTE